MRIQRKVAAVGAVNMAIGGDCRRDDPGEKASASWSDESERDRRRTAQATTFERSGKMEKGSLGRMRAEDEMLFQPASREKGVAG